TICATRGVRSGWRSARVQGRLGGDHVGDAKLDALAGVVREAAANSGRVSDATWAVAVGHGWDDDQLAEAFAYLGLTVFTSYFLNYAVTELDVTVGPVGAGDGS